MPKTRPPYAPEFRRQLIEMVRAGQSPEARARKFEPSAQTIRNWVVQADLDEGRRQDGLTEVDPIGWTRGTGFSVESSAVNSSERRSRR